MKVIAPYYEIIDMPSGDDVLRKIEIAGRTCYKSEDKISKDSAVGFAKRLLKMGHLSVVEHVIATARIVCDRGVTHEIVRHRLASFSQESTRYANYSENRFNNEITVIRPFFWRENSNQYAAWHTAMLNAEKSYMQLIELVLQAFPWVAPVTN